MVVVEFALAFLDAAVVLLDVPVYLPHRTLYRRVKIVFYVVVPPFREPPLRQLLADPTPLMRTLFKETEK
jgi:hypothetical protein